MDRTTCKDVLILTAPKHSIDTLQSSPDTADEIDLMSIARVLWASRLLIVSATLAGLAIGGLYAKTRAPVWRSDALIQIESNPSRLALPEELSGLVTDTSASTMAEIEILRSRSVLSDAAAAVRLDWDVSPTFAPIIGRALHYGHFLDFLGKSFDRYPRSNESISIGYLQMPSDWIDLPISVAILEGGQYEILLPDGTTLTGVTDQLLTDKKRNFALEIEETKAVPGRIFEIRQSPESSSAARLAGAISVSEQGRQTGIFRVSMVATSRTEASRWLDAVLVAYKNQSVTKNAAEASQSLRFLEEQLPLAEAQVTDAERALIDYRAKQQSIDLSFETERLLAEAAGLESQIREAKMRERELGQRFTPSHPIYSQAIENRASLEQRLQEVRDEIELLPETQREVVNLTRTLEVAQATYLQMLNRAQELRVLRASEIGNVRVIDSAQATQRPVAPKRSRILALSGLLGLIVGFGGAILRNLLRRGVDALEEIEQIGIPVIGVTSLAVATVGKFKHRVPLVVRDDPEGINAEAFKSIRTAVRFLRAGKPNATIVLTSPMPGAGKSFCAANLAITIAQSGQRVCLVDADLRRGVLARSFGISGKEVGLTEYLAGVVSINEVVVPTSAAGLDLVPTGRRPPNPSELLMSEGLESLFSELTSRYDVVIFDTPPTLLVTDAALISRMAASTIAVARHRETELQDLTAMRRTLELGGGQVNGAILNAFDPKKANPSSSNQYGRYGYRGPYKHHYARDID